MKKKLLGLLAVNLICFFLLFPELLQEKTYTSFPYPVSFCCSSEHIKETPPIAKIHKNIAELLHQDGVGLNVINTTLTTLKCAKKNNIEHNHILAIIDYSLPSSEKRFWVFDLKEKKLLFHTYISHGINSGALLSNYFSNRYNSKATSIGIFKTEKAYYGREGLSLRLEGLEQGFNDNAFNRSIVMHGGWYVNEDFIKKYGRPGRSWGCPALPPHLTHSIINTIKDQSLFVVYYPSEEWLVKSKFLNCDHTVLTQNAKQAIQSVVKTDERREEVLFANTLKNQETPIMVIAANRYEQIFHTKAPLTRMLRRQINNMEYIALSTAEFQNLIGNNKDNLSEIHFVIPVIKMERGYYETQMKIVDLGKIKEVRLQKNNYIVYFENSFVSLKATNHFIRWLGL